MSSYGMTWIDGKENGGVNRFQKVLLAAKAGLWECQIKTGEEKIDARWAEILGYSLDELLPMTSEKRLRLVHPDDVDESRRRLQKHLSGEKPSYQCDLRMKHKDGSWVYVYECGIVVERDKNAVPRTMVGAHVDISGRKREQESIKENEQKFRNLVRKIALPVAIVSTSGAIVFLNDMFVETFGYTAEMAPTLTALMELAFPDEVERNWAARTWGEQVGLSMSNGTGSEKIECCICCADGHKKTVLVSGNVHADEVILTLIDVSDLRRSESILKKSFEIRRINDLLCELIRGDIPSSQLLYECVHVLGRRAQRPGCVYMIRVDDSNDNRQPDLSKRFSDRSGRVGHIIEAIDHPDRILWHDFEGIGVVSLEPEAASGQIEQQAALGNTLVRLIGDLTPPVRIGVSGRMENIAEIADCFRQAKIACHMGPKIDNEAQVHHFLSLGLYQVLPAISDATIVSPFIERTLGKILQIKGSKRQEYLNSLEVMLMSDSYKESAERLGVHYQTMMYRRRKLEKILGVSLDHIISRSMLITALHLLKIQGK